jgi:hypothetical protein
MRRKGLLLLLLLITVLLVMWLPNRLQTLLYNRAPSSPQNPIWNTLTIGSAVEDDVVALLGQPTHIIDKQSPDRKTLVYTQDATGLTQTIIQLRSGVVESVVVQYGPKNSQYLDQFLAAIGTPDIVLWSGMSGHWRILIYLNEGIMLEVNGRSEITEAEIVHEYYFAPCSVNCIKEKFPAVIADRGPRYTWNSDVRYGQRDPWGYTTFP